MPPSRLACSFAFTEDRSAFNAPERFAVPSVQFFEEALRLARRAQNERPLPVSQTAQPLQDARPALARVRPNPPRELPRQALSAAFSHVGARASAEDCAALDDAPEAECAREVQKDHGVAGGEAAFERAAVVAVHYP